MNGHGDPCAPRPGGVAPYLIVSGAAAAIDFYMRALGARERMRLEHDGRVGHAELDVEGGGIMLADEFPERQALSPRSIGGTPVMIHIYVRDVDALAVRARAEGMKELRAVETQFYGDRGGLFEDPFGHRWWIATHVEDVAPDEIRRRAAALHGLAP